jgi:hypothetical protein
MARIYTSRQLLDPSLISMANQAMQNRLAQESARRKNVIDAWSNVGTTAGSAFDKYMDAKRAEDEQKKRFQSVYLRSSEEDRRDPLFRAALDEYSRTGSASPLSNLILQRQAAEAREAAAEEALAERKAKENALRIAETNAAQETYAKLQKDMLDALDAGKTQDAAIKQKALEALEKKYINEDGTSPFGDTAASIKLAREEEIHNRKEAEENENKRLLDVANFLAGLPTTYKNDDDKKPIIEAINKSETLNAKEKADAINKVLGIESGKTATKKAVQSAVAGKAGEKAGKAIDDKDETIEKAKKALELISNGRKVPTSLQDALNKARKNGWVK